MSFRTKTTGSILAGEGISRRAIIAQDEDGKVTETRAAKMLDCTVAALRRWVAPCEWHHHKPEERVLKVNYYMAEDLEECRTLVQADTLYLNMERVARNRSKCETPAERAGVEMRYEKILAEWQEATGEEHPNECREW